MAKILCEGTGVKPSETRVMHGETWGKCGTCHRVLKPKNDGTLRQHQARGRTTVSTDKTMDSLWAYAADNRKG